MVFRKLLETTALVARRINPPLTITGVIVCLFDSGTKLAQEVVNDLTAFLDKSRGSNVAMGRSLRLRDTDSPQHQARGVSELRQVDLRLRAEKPAARSITGRWPTRCSIRKGPVIGPMKLGLPGRIADAAVY